MEKKPERIQDVINRVFRPPVERASLSLCHEPPPCVLSNDDKVLLCSVVKLWLNGADLACTFADMLVAADQKPEAIAKAMWSIDRMLEKLPPGEEARKLADMRGILARQRTLPEAEMNKAVQTLNQLIDAISPFTPVVEKLTKYCAKLGLAELAVEKAFDAIEDFQFARDVRSQLALRE